jgi:hypothetical protein
MAQRRPGEIDPALADAISRVIDIRLDERINDLRAELARSQLRFCGVWESGRSYQPNALVVRQGGLWCCLQPTTATPGSSADWQLAVKQGEIPKAGPTLR